MGHLKIRSWILCALLAWTFVVQTEAGPQYLVAIPAVIEAGTEAKFCSSLLQPNETLTMTVDLKTPETTTTLLKQTSDTAFHYCNIFEAPQVEKVVYTMEVTVEGATFYSRQLRKVMVRSFNPLTFVQSDKPIYLPGQTVNFRVVSMDTKFKAIKEMYKTIEIENPHKSLIGQWLNQTSDDKIVQLSFALNAEAVPGRYQIIVSAGEQKIYHNFKVEKYVLPKFDIQLNTKDEAFIPQEEITVEVCSKYTFGQPVPGIAKIEACRPLSRYGGYSPSTPTLEELINPPCFTEEKQINMMGCATFTMAMSTFTKISPKALQDRLEIKAEVVEEGTGVTHKQQKEVRLSYVLGTLSFVQTPEIYETGADLSGKVKAVYFNGSVAADMTLHLFDGRWPRNLLANLTTGGDGIAVFSLPTEDKVSMSLHVRATLDPDHHHHQVPHFEDADFTAKLAQAPSDNTRPVSSLTVSKITRDMIVCGRETSVNIHYTVVGESQAVLSVMYLVLSRGIIVQHGVLEVQTQDQLVTKGSLEIQVMVSPEMSPVFQVVAYAVLPSETVIATSSDFPFEKCFKNQVSVEFSQPKAVPGEKSIMHITTDPNSLCGVSVIDQSVLIKEPGKTLNAETIMNLLPVKKSNFIPYEVEDETHCLPVRHRRYVMPYPTGDNDAFTVFNNIGLKMATNLFIRMPPCLRFRGREYHFGHGLRMYDSPPMRTSFIQMSMGGGAAPEPIVTVRNFFPETWIWDLLPVGDSGKTAHSVVVPDTITTWESEVFCLSPEGIGVAPRQNLTVFQPFFLEITLPYSIIRGESFELKATVFNFMSSPIMVVVTPSPSLDYTLEPLSADLSSSCFRPNERKTFKWKMVPKTLGVVDVSLMAEAVPSPISCGNDIVSVPERGRIDRVTKSLIVKPEGTEVSKSHNWLLCPNGQSLTEEIEIALPGNVIEGSARASLSVLGDILGRALKNLDGLLRMPYGCGEQNLALLAPNIYILQYLKGTDQLTPAILKKASNFLTSGYQRQLNYKHDDGGYSTFGTGVQNTWLTTFVVRSFTGAKNFIFIDPEVITQSKNWLERKQKESGCFQQSGRLFNNRMKGGVSDEVTLTAYITITFLEMGMLPNDPVVKNSLTCLKASLPGLQNTYTMSLMAYVFTLAGDMEIRSMLLEKLDKVAVHEGSSLHWSQVATDTSDSLSVEISSYVLLAKLSIPPTTADLGYASNIIRWLTKQQNYYGGFSSTQDTVTALQALALYSTLVFSPKGSSTVTVQGPNQQVTFDVNQDNKLVYQEKLLTDTAGKYSMEVKGTTCASIQLALHYNIPPPSTSSTLMVSVEVAVVLSTSAEYKLHLDIKALYTGKDGRSNMVIIDVKLLSGFVPDSASIKTLKGSFPVSRVEQEKDHVLIYMDSMPKDLRIPLSLVLDRQHVVSGLKPALVKIYDYYQPTDKHETEYIISVSSD